MESTYATRARRARERVGAVTALSPRSGYLRSARARGTHGRLRPPGAGESVVSLLSILAMRDFERPRGCRPIVRRRDRFLPAAARDACVLATAAAFAVSGARWQLPHRLVEGVLDVARPSDRLGDAATLPSRKRNTKRVSRSRRRRTAR